MLLLLVLGPICWLWVSGIDYMHNNHPDYKGDDLFGGWRVLVLLIKTGKHGNVGSTPTISTNRTVVELVDTLRDKRTSGRNDGPWSTKGWSKDYALLWVRIPACCDKVLYKGQNTGVMSLIRNIMRLWCNGSIAVSKTVGGGSNPSGRAKRSSEAVAAHIA